MIAGVIPTVILCILIITVFSLLVVLFVILYRRNKNKWMSVNQRGWQIIHNVLWIHVHSFYIQYTLQQMDNIYYVHTLQNNREVKSTQILELVQTHQIQQLPMYHTSRLTTTLWCIMKSTSWTTHNSGLVCIYTYIKQHFMFLIITG